MGLVEEAEAEGVGQLVRAVAHQDPVRVPPYVRAQRATQAVRLLGRIPVERRVEERLDQRAFEVFRQVERAFILVELDRNVRHAADEVRTLAPHRRSDVGERLFEGCSFRRCYLSHRVAVMGHWS
jgi:hypothetical protein